MHAPKEHAIVFVTAPNITVARKIAAAALAARLTACANLIPKIESHYWWQGRLESSSEVLILMKTRVEKLDDLERCIVKNHPYDTPEFISTRLDAGNEKYLQWLTNSVQMGE